MRRGKSRTPKLKEITRTGLIAALELVLPLVLRKLVQELSQMGAEGLSEADEG